MSIRVLLADDHVILRDGLQFLLEMHPGFDVVGVADNGREAVDGVETLQPDVAVLDIAMPEMDGLEAAALIRQRSPNTQIVILSMHSTSEHIRKALQAGAQAYLLKESASKELLEAIREVHAGRRYVSQGVSDKMFASLALEEDLSPDPLDLLSDRERQVLQLVAEGRTSAEIAEVLYLSPRTVDTYRSRLMQKLDIPHIAGLVKFALRHGLISID